MAIEAGGKCGVFPYDAVTEEYIKGRVNRPVEPIAPDADAVYAQTITIDLSKLQPVVAFPHLPSNTHYINEIDKDIKIDQVIIGTKVALNLTKRQLICFSGAGAVGIPFYIFTKGFIGTQASALLMVCLLYTSITQLLQKLWKQFQSIVKKMVSLIHLLTMTKWR